MSALLQAEKLALPGRLAETSLSLARGELVCLVGPNGSGKTSLLHAIAGVGSPDGHVTIDGANPRAVPSSARPRLLAFLPASRDVRWPLAARDLIALGGAEPAEIEETIRALELEDVADRRLDRLSTGERSRVLIARALAPHPKMLLLDEPTANLDPLWQIRLMDMLRDYVRRFGRAALVAIHDLDSAARFADRMIVMEDKRVAADGAPDALLAGDVIPDIFGIERADGVWRPAVRPREDRRSSP